MTAPFTVLVIDDDEHVARALACGLQAKGFPCIFTTDAKEGIGLARRVHPDVIVCDAVMPRLQARDVVDSLRTDRGTARIPVLVVSGHDPARFDPISDAPFLAKPFTPAALVSTLEILMPMKGQRKAQPQASQGRSPRLLMVSNRPADAVMASALRKSGCAVTIADTAQAGLTRAREIEPDLILVDGTLRGQIGAEFVSQQRRGLQTAAIPILVIDGFPAFTRLLQTIRELVELDEYPAHALPCRTAPDWDRPIRAQPIKPSATRECESVRRRSPHPRPVNSYDGQARAEIVTVRG